MTDQDRHLNIVTGGADVKPKPPDVRTRDQAVNYLDHSIEMLLQKRVDCDVFVPGDPAKTVRQQQKAERKLLVHVGKVMGEAAVLFAVGLIEQNTYERYHQLAINALAAKVVGVF